MVRLFTNVRNTKQLSISLGLGLHARSHLGVLIIMRTVRNQPRYTWENLVNDLKAAGTIVAKKTIGNTLRHEGLKSFRTCKVLLLKKAHSPAEVC